MTGQKLVVVIEEVEPLRARRVEQCVGGSRPIERSGRHDEAKGHAFVRVGQQTMHRTARRDDEDLGWTQRLPRSRRQRAAERRPIHRSNENGDRT
jgi:hypothetical protein